MTFSLFILNILNVGITTEVLSTSNTQNHNKLSLSENHKLVLLSYFYGEIILKFIFVLFIWSIKLIYFPEFNTSITNRVFIIYKFCNCIILLQIIF